MHGSGQKHTSLVVVFLERGWDTCDTMTKMPFVWRSIDCLQHDKTQHRYALIIHVWLFLACFIISHIYCFVLLEDDLICTPQHVHFWCYRSISHHSSLFPWAAVENIHDPILMHKISIASLYIWQCIYICYGTYRLTVTLPKTMPQMEPIPLASVEFLQEKHAIDYYSWRRGWYSVGWATYICISGLTNDSVSIEAARMWQWNGFQSKTRYF